MATVSWYCHECGNGPWMEALYTACIMCPHRRCSLCATEERKDAECISATPGDESSNGFAAATTHQGLSPSKASNHVDNDSTLHATETALRHNQESVKHTCGILPGIQPSLPPISLHWSGKSYTESPVDGETVYTCCNCGVTAGISAVNPSCYSCGHEQCGGCQAENVH